MRRGSTDLYEVTGHDPAKGSHQEPPPATTRQATASLCRERGELFASSSALDTDFTAKLLDVYPPSKDWPGGFDLNIGDGIVRARYRESLQHEKLLQPGQVYEFTIHLYPTSNVFKKGHRLRVDISSSNLPRFDVNSNSGEPLNQHRLLRSAEQRSTTRAPMPAASSCR